MPEETAMRSIEDCKCTSVLRCMPVQEAAMIRKGCREFFLPVLGLAIAAGAVGIAVPAQPQYDAVLTRFTVSPAIAAFFRINNLILATDGQLMEITAFNSDLFIPGNFSNMQLMTPVKAIQNVEVNVTNLDVVNPHDFSAGFKGYVQKFS